MTIWKPLWWRKPLSPHRPSWKASRLSKRSRQPRKGTIRNRLTPGAPKRGGVLAAPMSWCPVHDPAVDSALSVFFSLSDVPLVTEIHARPDENQRRCQLPDFAGNSLIPTTLKTMGSFTNSFSDKTSNSVTTLR